MKVVCGQGVPLKSWAEGLEETAFAQAISLTLLPFAYKHVALMPDAHQGYGMPIGGVLATEGVVVPNAIGVDIGCGMRFGETETLVEDLHPGELDAVMLKIQEAIPTGFNHHQKAQSGWATEQYLADMDIPIVTQEYEASLRQIGTLGGGNHFIEAQEGETGRLCFMVHSGSRNIGFKVANHYNKLAIEMNEMWHTSVPKNWELAFLPIESANGKAYMREMSACLEFAWHNRAIMWEAITDVLWDELGVDLDIGFDIHHNYAAWENHYGKNVLVHRKGAVRARYGERVIIPGSMGTHSYIGMGQGNDDSFQSCSHGAGRKMGRREAKRVLDNDAEMQDMKDAGIRLFGGGRGNDWLDECKSAYKNIDDVMAQQADLVHVLQLVSPLAVVKA